MKETEICIIEQDKVPDIADEIFFRKLESDKNDYFLVVLNAVKEEDTVAKELKESIIDDINIQYKPFVKRLSEDVFIIFPENFIVIGDIHGEIDKLNNLLNNIKPKVSDTLVFLGDYIDDGKDSVAVIERLLQLQYDHHNCIFLKGDHEQKFLKALETFSEEDITNSLVNGGAETLKQYLQMKNDNFYLEQFKRHINFFKNLKNYYVSEDYIFVHAGINPFKSLNEQTEDDLLHIKNEFIFAKNYQTKKIIFGHTVFDGGFIKDNKIGIDTGCGTDKDVRLTAYICKENKFIQSDF